MRTIITKYVHLQECFYGYFETFHGPLRSDRHMVVYVRRYRLLWYAFGRGSPSPLRTLEAPILLLAGFRPLPSVLRLFRPPRFRFPSASHIFGLCCRAQQLLCPWLTSAVSSHPIPKTVALGKRVGLPGYCTPTFSPYTLSHMLPHLPKVYRALNLLGPRCCILSASCSSGRGFACRFL